MLENKSTEVGTLLLEIGALLMSAGANTNRIRLTMRRIAKSYGYKAEFLITHRAIMLTLQDKKGNLSFNQVKQTYAQTPNFKIVSGISRLSWRIADENLQHHSALEEIERLKALPYYPRLVILVTVALACSAFCRLSSGHLSEMGIVFIASFLGLIIKQELTNKKANPYFTVFLSSFITTMICGILGLWLPHEHYNMTFVTSVLYLIPGIPLINSMSDILDGNSLNGIIRALNGLVVSFCIALGLVIAVLIFNVV